MEQYPKAIETMVVDARSSPRLFGRLLEPLDITKLARHRIPQVDAQSAILERGVLQPHQEIVYARPIDLLILGQHKFIG